MNTRLSNYLNQSDTLNECQAGFRNGYATLDHIFVLNSIVDLYLHRKKRVYAAFVDYTKAFDLIERTALWRKLLNSNINGKILRVIYNMYANAKSCIRSGHNLSDFFTCARGVRQGENLSPLLFAIYLNDFEEFLSEKYTGLEMLATEIRNNVNDGEIGVYVKLFTLLYADDTVILAETEAELQKALDSLEEYCLLWGLTVNLDKTKIIIFSRGKVRNYRQFRFAGEDIEVVADYVYLGIRFNYNNSFSKAVEKQLVLAKKAMFSMLSKVAKLDLPVDIQLGLYDQLVVPVLLYGCEIWGCNNLSGLELFQRKFLKNLLQVSKYTANCIIYGETGRHELETTISLRMINFWYSIKFGKNSKLSHIIFRHLESLFNNNTFKSKWCNKIKTILDNVGLSYYWTTNNVNLNRMTSRLQEKLSDANLQNWSAKTESSSLCVNYRMFKTQFGFKYYLKTLPKDLRIIYF